MHDHDGIIITLITLNIAVFMFWHKRIVPRNHGYFMLKNFTTSYDHLQSGLYYTLLTSVFSHMNISHLLANMIGLFFFGKAVNQVIGPKRFLTVYLGSGMLSSFASVYQQKSQGQGYVKNLGASGAVNAITTMAILFSPRSTILIMGILPMPAFAVGGLFLLRDLDGAFRGSTIGDHGQRVGHWAHLTGAACGAGYYYYLQKLVRR